MFKEEIGKWVQETLQLLTFAAKILAYLFVISSGDRLLGQWGMVLSSFVVQILYHFWNLRELYKGKRFYDIQRVATEGMSSRAWWIGPMVLGFIFGYAGWWFMGAYLTISMVAFRTSYLNTIAWLLEEDVDVLPVEANIEA